MLLKYAALPKMQKDPWIRLKCFYDQDGHYGEFYINIHPVKHLILITSKEAYYDAVLIKAFAEAMRQF